MHTYTNTEMDMKCAYLYRYRKNVEKGKKSILNCAHLYLPANALKKCVSLYVPAGQSWVRQRNYAPYVADIKSSLLCVT